MITEDSLVNKYCNLIRQYAQERHYFIQRDECSDFGSHYFVIKKFNGDCAYIKIRVSNHQCKFDDIDLQFRVDMLSLKRPIKNLREKIFKSLENTMKRAETLHLKSYLKDKKGDEKNVQI